MTKQNSLYELNDKNIGTKQLNQDNLESLDSSHDSFDRDDYNLDCNQHEDL